MKDTSYLIVKRIRKEKKLSLKELSAKCGLSISFLSNYENGKVNITVTSLHQIAKALDVPIKVLLTTERDDSTLVVRSGERFAVVQHKSGHTIQEFLTRGTAFDMHVTVMHMPPHTNSGDPDCHEGEEFVFVLEGTLTVLLDKRNPIVLEKGDMVYYSPLNNHCWRNDGDTKLEFLAVVGKGGF